MICVFCILCSCSLTDDKPSHDPDFEDTFSLDLKNSSVLYLEEDPDSYYILYGIDKNGTANEIICMDKNGDTIKYKSMNLTCVIDLNKDYFLIKRSWSSSDDSNAFLIVNKQDGSAQPFPIPAGASNIIKGPDNNTFYFWISSDMYRFTLNGTSPENIEYFYSIEIIESFLISGNGELLVADDELSRSYIIIASDGSQINISLNADFPDIYVNPHGYFEYHDTENNKMVTLTYNSATGVVNTVEIDDNGLPTKNNIKTAFRNNNYVIQVGFLNFSGIYEMHNPTNLPREITFPETHEIITAASTETHYFLSCRDTSGKPSLLKIDPLTDEKTVILPLNEYEINEIIPLYDNNLFLTGINMISGKTCFIFLKQADGSKITISENYNQDLPEMIILN